MHRWIAWKEILTDLQKRALLAAALGTFFIGTTAADDTEIFFSAESHPPNVMFIIDVSGSMDRTDDKGLPDIADNVLWLDANDTNTLIDGNGDPLSSPDNYSGPITQWRDKSGQNNHLTGTSATLGTINKRITVRFTDDNYAGSGCVWRHDGRSDHFCSTAGKFIQR